MPLLAEIHHVAIDVSKHKELLAKVLGSVDHSTMPPDLREAVDEFVSEYGGCAFCGRPADLFCDRILGFELAGTYPWPHSDGTSVVFTCDAPMCQSCATYVGNKFFDGDKAHTGIESIDLCPVHRASGCDIPDMAYKTAKDILITAAQAERMRLRDWKAKVFS